jgi:hypothetical protein
MGELACRPMKGADDFFQNYLVISHQSGLDNTMYSDSSDKIRTAENFRQLCTGEHR